MKNDIQQTSEAERSGFVEEIMQRDFEEATRKPPERPRRSWGPLLVVMIPVLVGLTAWNVFSMTRTTGAFSPPIETEAARFTIYLIAQAVEEYRDAAGALPPSLEYLDLDEEDIEYARLDDSYTLTASVGDNRIVYRAGEDLQQFWIAYETFSRARP